jgi:hypothetical protein
MNDRIDFERLVNERFAREHDVRPPDRAVDEILTQAGRARPLPRWLALIKEPSMRYSSSLAVGSPTARVLALLAATLLLVALVTAAGAGAARLLAADGELVVDANGDGTHTTIADAVADAADGDTIHVRPGTYTETVNIDKDITLMGDGPRKDIVIVAPDDGPTWSVDGSREEDPYAILVIDSDATISGLTFRGTASEVILHGGSPTLQDSAFEMVGKAFDGSDTSFGGSSVVVTGGSDAVVSENDVTDGGPIGLFAGSTAQIDGNTLRGGPHLFLVSDATGTAVTKNTVVGTMVYGINSHGEGTVISGNEIADPGEVGIRIRNGSATVTRNSVSGAATGIWAGGGTAEIVGNELVGNDVGVSGLDVSLVQGNSVRNGGTGVMISAGEVLVDGNVVEDNSASGLTLGATTTVTLTDNVICGNGENLTLLGVAKPRIGEGNEICEDTPAA